MPDSSNHYSVQGIEERMEKDGFPEMRKHWSKFRKLRIDLMLVNNGKIEGLTTYSNMS